MTYNLVSSWVDLDIWESQSVSMKAILMLIVTMGNWGVCHAIRPQSATGVNIVKRSFSVIGFLHSKKPVEISMRG